MTIHNIGNSFASHKIRGIRGSAGYNGFSLKAGSLKINGYEIKIRSADGLGDIARKINRLKSKTGVEAIVTAGSYNKPRLILETRRPELNIIDHDSILLKLYKEKQLGTKDGCLIQVMRTNSSQKPKINYEYRIAEAQGTGAYLHPSLLDELHKYELNRYVTNNPANNAAAPIKEKIGPELEDYYRALSKRFVAQILDRGNNNASQLQIQKGAEFSIFPPDEAVVEEPFDKAGFIALMNSVRAQELEKEKLASAKDLIKKVLTKITMDLREINIRDKKAITKIQQELFGANGENKQHADLCSKLGAALTNKFSKESLTDSHHRLNIKIKLETELTAERITSFFFDQHFKISSETIAKIEKNISSWDIEEILRAAGPLRQPT